MEKGTAVKQIKELKPDELKQIYKTHVKEDFPRSERRPYSSMEKMTNAGKYISFGYYDDDSLLAYACYIVSASESTRSLRLTSDERDHNRVLCGYDMRAENGMYALLDYFAVVPELRGRGTGSEFLQKLEGILPAKNGAFIEAESPDSAKSEEEAALRRRRIHFYLSNDAVLTNTKCLLFGVDYNILYIGRADDTNPAQEQLHCAIEDLYQEIYRPVYGRLCKPYVSEENQ
ncbi:MAG: GNAT family N-acetyltransferase [Lachnospiraceae bacterium]|nr:GNAT family N-acetyltransferase [Lachnospiraceae bacterium]